MKGTSKLNFALRSVRLVRLDIRYHGQEVNTVVNKLIGVDRCLIWRISYSCINRSVVALDMVRIVLLLL